MASLDSRQQPKLLTQVRLVVRSKHYSPRTEESYVGWVRRYVRFLGMRHPTELGAQDVNRFLSALADSGRLSASSQTQALSALLFLYRDVLRHDIDNIGQVTRAKQPARLPVVLNREEIRAVLGELQGEARIAGLLMYGGGLRLLETLQLRVKDIDFLMGQIVVRRAKGGKDRVTVLAEAAIPELRAQLDQVRTQHEHDLERGGGRTLLPHALDRKSPAAGKEWRWQFVFPATRRYRDPTSGEWIRHHLHESVVQRAGERHHQAGDVSHVAALVRDSSAAGWLRHPDRPGMAGPPRRGNHDGVHSCAQPGWKGSKEPGRPALAWEHPENGHLPARYFPEFTRGRLRLQLLAAPF